MVQLGKDFKKRNERGSWDHEEEEEDPQTKLEDWEKEHDGEI